MSANAWCAVKAIHGKVVPYSIEKAATALSSDISPAKARKVVAPIPSVVFGAARPVDALHTGGSPWPR